MCRGVVVALLTLAVDGCASSAVEVAGLEAGLAEDAAPERLVRTHYYSAFDGQNTYRIPVALDTLELDGDPLDLSSLRWSHDASYLSVTPNSDQTGGVLYTTRKSGVTQLRVSATSESGQTWHDTATVEISAADPALRRLGEESYTSPVRWTPLPSSGAATSCSRARTSASTAARAVTATRYP